MNQYFVTGIGTEIGIDADSEIQAAVSRSTARRPQVSRSQTFDAFAYAPASSASRSTRFPGTRIAPALA